VALFFHKLRVLIHKNTEDIVEFAGGIEVDESYFGGIRKEREGEEQQGKYLCLGY
jgi:hypothetical protein